MAISTNTTTGVKAIKVSKTDALGNDQTLLLQEGELLTLVFDDIGIQRFKITSVSEYLDYYLYYVVPTLLGINESDFHVPEDVSGTGTGVINAGNYELQGTGGGLVEGKRFADYNNFDNLTSWNFTNSTGRLTSIIGLGGNRFALTVRYQVEVYTNATTPDSYAFSIEPEGTNWVSTYNDDVVSSNPDDIINGNVVTLVAPTNGTGNARSITGSFNIVADAGTVGVLGIKPVSQYGAVKFFFPTGSINIDIQSYISGSSDNNGVNTVLEPYITENFAISDYNATINNAVNDRINEFYMDVDYSSNAIVAVNSDIILNDTATRAKVQYSNYTTARIVRPRYEGSKNTSPDLNELSGSQLPAVEQTTGFFLYNRGGNFNTIADRSGSAQYNIGFLIDDLGNTYEPQESESAYLPNLLSGFGRGSKVTFAPTDTGSSAAGTFDVHYPATKIKPILYSDTGSLGNNFLVSGTIAGGNLSLFQSPSAFVDFNSEAKLTSNQVFSGNTNGDILFTNVTLDQEDGWGYNSSGDWSYTVQNSSNVSGRFDIDIVVDPGTPTLPYNDIALQLYRNGDLIAQDDATGVSLLTTLSIYKSLRFVEGDNYVIKFDNSGTNTTTIVSTPLSGNTLVTTAAEKNNYPAAGSSVSVPYANSFTTGTTISTVLTASQDIAKWYGGAYIQGNNIPGYQFNIPYVFEQYDEVRWNGTEEFVSLIERVEWSNTPSISGDQYEMYVYLTAPIDTSIIDLDYYEFRRNIFQKDSIVVNTPGPVIEKGFILPEYQTPLLKQNLSNIIQDLTDKGLV